MTLSKVIREEFLAILFAEAECYLSDLDPLGCREPGSRPETWIRDELLYVDRIQNVFYSTSLFLHINEYRGNAGIGAADDQHRDDKSMLERSAEPISFLTGTEVLRNSCSIYLSPIIPKATLLLQSPFIGAVKGLTGFKTVMLHLFTMKKAHKRDGATATDHYTMVRAFTDAIRATLEGSLGPSEFSDVRVRYFGPASLYREGQSISLESEITFHPRDYVSKGRNPKSSPNAQGDMGNDCSPQDGSS